MNEQSLFDVARGRKPGAEREEFLRDACGGDQALRQRVLDLLAAHDRQSGLLDHAGLAREIGADLADGATTAVTPLARGTMIAGRYKLLELIGEGGMGAVWVAEQAQPVRRKVAVKLIKAGMDSTTVIARFEAERQALALMDHPNIAKVLDGGLTETGHPFFVMEYVKGVPIIDYCDATRLSIDERLVLFAQVCKAVQHAHQKGIIHRDLKPSNILVAPYDDQPVPKIIDFGLAKAMHQSLTERTLFTAHGSVLGTPLYMSPEQAQLNNLDVDTRSDIYSLGVLLYELLTGTTPLEKQRFQKAAWDEVRRIIREEDPPRPSARLGSTATLPSLAACRQTEPLKLTRQVRGELDWIVMKALEKDRTRRYETASGFAQDIERYLAGEGVLAVPPSATYRLKKFVRRNKVQVTAASLVLLALVAGVTGTSIGLVHANLAKVDARQKQERAELAEQRERQAKEHELTQRERAESAYARMADVLDTMVSDITRASLGAQKEITAEQKKFLTEVLTYYQEFAGVNGDDLTTRKRKAWAALRLGRIEFGLGHKEESVVALRIALEGYVALAADFPAVMEFSSGMVMCHCDLGVALNALEERAEAEHHYRKSVALLEKFAAEFPTVADIRKDLAGNLGNLGILLSDVGKRQEAEVQHRKALAILEKLGSEFPSVPEYRGQLANCQSNLGMLLFENGEPEGEGHCRQALAIREALAAEFPANVGFREKLAMSQHNMCILLAKLGNGREAVALGRKLLVIREELASEFPSVAGYRHDFARSQNNTGQQLEDLGQPREAEQHYRKGLSIMDQLASEFPAVPQYRADLGQCYALLGGLLRQIGKLPEADEQYRKALAIQEKLASEFPTVTNRRVELGGSYCNFGILVRESGKPLESLEWFAKAISVLAPVHEQETDALYPKEFLRNSYEHRAWAHDQLQQYTEAIQDWEKAIELSPMKEQPARCAERAQVMYRAGRLEAEEQYRKALANQEKLASEFPTVFRYQLELGGSYCNFGTLVRDSGKALESLEWFAKAISVLAPVHEQETDALQPKEFLRNSYLGRAVAHVRLQRFAEALPDWDKAIELSLAMEQPILRAQRANSRIWAGHVTEAVAEVADLLAPGAVETSWNDGQLYDFACIYAVASGKLADHRVEYSDRAMELLQLAIKAGWKNAAHMRKDTDLDGLRDRDDFKKLLAELEN